MWYNLLVGSLYDVVNNYCRPFWDEESKEEKYMENGKRFFVLGFTYIAMGIIYMMLARRKSKKYAEIPIKRR